MAKRRLTLSELIKAGLLVALVLPLAVVLVPGILIGIPAHRAYGRWLRTRRARTWRRRGKRILLVYPCSPNWQSYIDTTWLPQVAPHAVVLDWSDRGQWPKRAPVEVLAFRYWGGTNEFNPLALLFPRRGRVRTLRFWQAFRDLKHGNELALRTAEVELFEFIESIRREAA